MSFDSTKDVSLSPVVSGPSPQNEGKEASPLDNKVKNYVLTAFFMAGVLALTAGIVVGLYSLQVNHAFSYLGLGLGIGGTVTAATAFAIKNKFFSLPDVDGAKDSEVNPKDCSHIFAACQLR